MRRVIMTGAKYESAPLMSALKEVGAPKTLLQLHIFKVPANSRGFRLPKSRRRDVRDAPNFESPMPYYC